jgi:hypothetical protein
MQGDDERKFTWLCSSALGVFAGLKLMLILPFWDKIGNKTRRMLSLFEIEEPRIETRKNS